MVALFLSTTRKEVRYSRSPNRAPKLNENRETDKLITLTTQALAVANNGCFIIPEPALPLVSR